MGTTEVLYARAIYINSAYLRCSRRTLSRTEERNKGVSICAQNECTVEIPVLRVIAVAFMSCKIRGYKNRVTNIIYRERLTVREVA